ncbi:hypothetical protein [Mangrovicoccus algicola]|uniref:DUF2946 domain-containing protein n=1 Tax=Mangrovicoccus algicola TaxID=2771008 RepID=A0A8J6YQB6_9RHOB|nr:hypothetical protein [Mangrovicoccus algicola]MBE3637593.1 hypothetical protein [Mangrovicoccus algicola]
MTRLRSLPGFGLLLALVLIVAGAISATHLLPERQRAAEAFALALIGAQPGDLCGPDGAHGAHEAHHGGGCPFCHKLPEPGRLSAPDRVRILSLPYRPDDARDLVAGPQQALPHIPVRGPPRSA